MVIENAVRGHELHAAGCVNKEYTFEKNNYVIVAVKTDQRCTLEQHSYAVGSSHPKILQFGAVIQPK